MQDEETGKQLLVHTGSKKVRANYARTLAGKNYSAYLAQMFGGQPTVSNAQAQASNMIITPINKNKSEYMFRKGVNSFAKAGKSSYKIYLDEVFSYYDSLPFLSSENLVNDFLYYTSKKFSRINSYATTTGGTSRKITNILLSNDSYGIEWSHGHSMFSFANYSMKQNVKLSLRGKKLSESKLIDFNPLHNEVVIDTFRMNKNNFVKLYKELKKYDIKRFYFYTL